MRERVFPWYKGKGKEMGKTSFFRCTQSNTSINIDLLIKTMYPICSISVLLCVHLKNGVFPISFPFPLYQGNTLSPILSSVFLNCTQKPMTFACLSWDVVEFKKPRPILLKSYQWQTGANLDSCSASSHAWRDPWRFGTTLGRRRRNRQCRCS